MNLFPYASAIALSRAGVALLSAAFILNLMQLIVQPSVEMIPCLTVCSFLRLSSTGLSNMRICQNRLCLMCHSLQI